MVRDVDVRVTPAIMRGVDVIRVTPSIVQGVVIRVTPAIVRGVDVRVKPGIISAWGAASNVTPGIVGVLSSE
jgi:hypothetical protein